MNKLSDQIVAFSGGKVDAYTKFQDYYNHYSAEVLKKNIGTYSTVNKEGKIISFAEKNDQMHDVMLKEVERVTGMSRPAGVADEMWATNPIFKWATFAVVTQMIETILPSTVIDSIGLYTDMRFIGWGDVANFEVPNRALFTVSMGADAQRTTMVQKQFKGNQSVAIYNHVITAQVNLMSVLAKRENLAEFARRAVISIETDMSKSAYSAVTTGLAGANVPAALKQSGAFDMNRLITLGQTVGAYNFNMKPVFAGTLSGLMKVVPSAAAGYRINTEADNMKLELIRTAYGFDFLVLPQVATGDYSTMGLALNDNLIMAISPAADKLVRGVIEGSTLTNSNDPYDNANLTTNFTINKRYGFEYISGAVAGSYTITA